MSTIIAVSLTSFFLVPAYTVAKEITDHVSTEKTNNMTSTDIEERLKEKKRKLAEAKVQFVHSMDKLNEELVALKN
jgi:hypothetical protein